MFQWWKSREVEERIFQHFDLVESTMLKSQESLLRYLDGDEAQATELARETGRLEGEADDVRREVESLLIQGAMMPASLQDLWEIIERIDKLADTAEAMLDYTLLQQVEIPSEIHGLIHDIYDRSIDVIQELNQALKHLFQDFEKTLDHTVRIENLEHHIDEFEHDAIRETFALDIELAHKMQIRNFIMILTDISDEAEDVSDLLELAVARRRS